MSNENLNMLASFMQKMIRGVVNLSMASTLNAKHKKKLSSAYTNHRQQWQFQSMTSYTLILYLTSTRKEEKNKSHGRLYNRSI